MSTTPLDNDGADRPVRVVARILKSYGFEARLDEDPQSPRSDYVHVTFSSHKEEEVGTMAIVDILNEHGYKAWFQRGYTSTTIHHVTLASPGTADNQVTQIAAG